MSFFSILDHPADLAITFNAPSLGAVYQLAAQALFELMYDSSKPGTIDLKTQEVVSGFDKEELLVNWLNHLIFLQEKMGMQGIDFQIELTKENELVAIIGWQRTDKLPLCEIKMATYHDLEITPNDDIWRVSLIFDL